MGAFLNLMKQRLLLVLLFGLIPVNTKTLVLQSPFVEKVTNEKEFLSLAYQFQLNLQVAYRFVN